MNLRVLQAPVPLVSWGRAGHACQVRKVKEDVYEVVCEGDAWRYVGGRRVDRYLRPDGIRQARNKMLRKYLPEGWNVCAGWIVVEIGANVGELSVALAEQKAVVHAFEPDPAPYGMCQWK